jgi:hypothetical protein
MVLGLFLGLRHAFEADHIAAVAAIASRERNPIRSSFIGGFWGAGHLTSLLLVGLPVVGLGLHFPHELDVPLELGVAAMIVFLGVGGLTRGAAVRDGHGHTHSIRSFARRPFCVGAAHGLAGSGALTLVILATMPSRMDGLFYLGSFGLGSVTGMMAASAALSIPIAAWGVLGSRATLKLSRAISLASVIFGLYYGAATIADAIAHHSFS